jgi:PKD repeat protein
MRKMALTTLALLLTVTTATAVVIDGLADDKSYRSNGTSQGSGSATELYTGTQVTGIDVGFVTHFLIPPLNGASITDAELSLTVTGNALTETNANIYLEIYGARSTSAGTGPVPEDYTNATTKLVSNWLQLNTDTANGTYTASSSELTAWLAAQAGTNGNMYVFLTAKPNTAPTGAYKLLTFASGNATADLPQLTISTNGAPTLTSYFTATPDSGWAPLTVSFDDASIGDITNRYWDFGDGTTTNTTLTTLDHTYASTGTYTVALTVSGPLGSDTSTQTDLISVRAPVAPVASFSADPVSGWTPLTVSFIDTSTGDITNRYWDFGDGSTTNTTASSLQHTYTSTGNFTVSLTTQGPVGSDTDTQTDLIAASYFPDNMRETFSETTDATIGLNTNLEAGVLWDGDSTLLAGDDAYTSGKGDCAAILVFQLPEIGGESISDANLSVFWEGDFLASPGTGHPDSSDTTLPKWVDLYGIRYDTNNIVLSNDYGYKTKVGAEDVLIQEQFLYQDIQEGTDPTEEETNASGDAVLAAWLQAQYDAGAVAGDYVFLRIHALFDTANVFKVYSGNSTTPPILTLTLGNGEPSEPPPASVVSLGSIGSGQNVINWTTAQGSGFVYSVWYSTNLLDGFQPLETNLADTVQSLTNTIDSPAVFYKITAE